MLARLVFTGLWTDSTRRPAVCHAVTGVLLQGTRGRFLACLEGERKEVESAYLALAKDPAGRKISLVSVDAVESRMFGNFEALDVEATEVHSSPLHPAEPGFFDVIGIRPEVALTMLRQIAGMFRQERAAVDREENLIAGRPMPESFGRGTGAR